MQAGGKERLLADGRALALPEMQWTQVGAQLRTVSTDIIVSLRIIADPWYIPYCITYSQCECLKSGRNISFAILAIGLHVGTRLFRGRVPVFRGGS